MKSGLLSQSRYLVLVETSKHASKKQDMFRCISSSSSIDKACYIILDSCSEYFSFSSFAVGIRGGRLNPCKDVARIVSL